MSTEVAMLMWDSYRDGVLWTVKEEFAKQYHTSTGNEC